MSVVALRPMQTPQITQPLKPVYLLASGEPLLTRDWLDEARRALRAGGFEDIQNLQEIVRRVPVADHVISYALRLTRMTRTTKEESPEFIKNWVGEVVGIVAVKPAGKLSGAWGDIKSQ